jgi:hypothetical protein
MENKKIMKILVIIGAMCLLVGGITQVMAGVRHLEGTDDGTSFLIGIIWVIIALVLILSVEAPGKPIPFTGIVILLLGIFTIILFLIGFFAIALGGIAGLSLLGGILVIIAGILGFKK